MPIFSYLETARILLRRFTPDDVDNLCDLDSDPEVMRYLTGGNPTPRAVIENEVLPAILSYYARGNAFGRWAAIEKASGQFLGWFALQPPDEARPDVVELGYRLRRSAWGHGYATEVSLALIRKGFSELGVRRVVATTYSENMVSRRVMEKVGMTFVRAFHLTWPNPEEQFEGDDVEYAIDKAAWEHQAIQDRC